MLLKLLKYNIKLEYVPGKNLVVADTLSRAYINTYTPEDEEMQYVIHALINNISISPEKKILFQQATQIDPDLCIRYSSPHFHQSNGLAEKAVNIVKNILKKSNNIKDLPFLIMEYNNTPLPMLGYSPSQLLLNRVMKTKIPISDEILKPNFIDHDSIQKQLQFKQDKQKIYFDRNSKTLIKLNKGENIMIQMGNYWKKGKVKDIVNERSYIVQDEFGKTYHRNRKFLNKTSLEYVPKYDTFLDDDQLLSNDPHTPEQLLQPENKNDSDLHYLNESDLPSLTNLFDDGNEDQQTPNSKVNINSNLPVQPNTNNSRPVREKSAPSYLKDYYLGNA
ncbi:hypothetical protein ILUMI_06171 [Ignelater luminosus]|uniref:Integrase catalytic domain-containing protein n=1 Tax=Ignelater luminosus TaxID=2038154 RepID=A0A8K0GI02_IGNLU|nr:hypothetical protein ILUMI_06171 [Ignelater luminosus]